MKYFLAALSVLFIPLTGYSEVVERKVNVANKEFAVLYIFKPCTVAGTDGKPCTPKLLPLLDEAVIRVFIPNSEGKWGGDPCQIVGRIINGRGSDDPKGLVEQALVDDPIYGATSRHVSPLGGPSYTTDCRIHNAGYFP